MNRLADQSPEDDHPSDPRRIDEQVRGWRRLGRHAGPVARVAGVLLVGLPVVRHEDRGTGTAARRSHRRELVLRAVAWFIGVGVVVATFIGPQPPEPASVVLTVLAIVAWSLTVVLAEGWLTWLLLMIVAGLGVGLNALNPEGPGFIVIFMAVASLAGRFRPKISFASCAVVAVAAVMSEVFTSRSPLTSGMTILIGVVFVFMAASFARAAELANARSQDLLTQEQAVRAAQQQAAVLGERNRLARELHDVLAHSLSGLSIQLSGAALLAEKTGADTRLIEQIRLAQASAHEGMNNAKRAVETLHRDALPGVDDLGDLVARTRQMTGLDIDLNVRGTAVAITPIAGLAVYRTVQESVTNVIRHAGRDASVTVGIDWDPERVDVKITDRGGDGGSAGLLPGGHGLRGLRERADQAGGRFEAGPFEDGWRVRLQLPTQDADGPAVDRVSAGRP